MRNNSSIGSTEEALSPRARSVESLRGEDSKVLEDKNLSEEQFESNEDCDQFFYDLTVEGSECQSHDDFENAPKPACEALNLRV